MKKRKENIYLTKFIQEQGVEHEVEPIKYKFTKVELMHKI